MVSIRFIKPNLPYQTGEIAGFYPELARNYVAKGVAEYFDPEAEAAAAKQAAKAAAKQAAKAENNNDTVNSAGKTGA